MNIKTIKFTFILGLVVIFAFTACNRNKDSTAITPQVVEQTATPETSTENMPEVTTPQTVTATAETDFEFSNGTITSYTGTATSVVIPSQIQGQAVTEIGWSAFIEKQLTDVTIPNSVNTIGPTAFLNNQLASVIIPNSVLMIHSEAFSENQLTSITIGANVKLGLGEQVLINGSWTSINCFSDSFDNFYNSNGKQAGTYTLNNGVWSLSGSQQQATAETDFEYENGTITKYIGTETLVVIPSQIQGQTVTAIGSFAFDDRVLESVTIPNSVTRIERRAFNRTYPTSISIGVGVELGLEESMSWEDYAFIGRGYFDIDYINEGKQEGTYIFNNDVWIRQ